MYYNCVLEAFKKLIITSINVKYLFLRFVRLWWMKCILLICLFEFETAWFLQVTSVFQKLTSSQSSIRLDNFVRVTHTHTYALRLWWVNLRVANYSLGKVLPFCSSSPLFGKSSEREAVGGGWWAAASFCRHPACSLPQTCTLLASGPLQHPHVQSLAALHCLHCLSF